MKYLLLMAGTLSLLISVPNSTTMADEIDPGNERQIISNDGRYKIFLAEHDGIFRGKLVKMKSIFKLDKKSGTVWRYRQRLDNKGNTFEEFFEVPNQ